MSWPCRVSKALIAWALLAACHEHREARDEPPTYQTLSSVFTRRCAHCHGAKQAEAGVRLDSYLGAIACTAHGDALTEPRDERAPLSAVLARADHASLLSASEREQLWAWLRAGAPAFRGTVHEPSIIDPRSEGWHGKLVANDDFRLLRDASVEQACGRCHAGAPVMPEGIRFPAPNAPACTSCHDQPAGVLACTTCHGQGSKAYAPRNACFFKADDAALAAGDAHDVHLSQTHFRTQSLSCTSCHPVPDAHVFAGQHADGMLDVSFSDPAAGDAGTFDAEQDTCSVGCHAQGGQLAEPRFVAQKDLSCQSCHLSPPDKHYPGPCSACHIEMGQTPTSLTPGRFHLDGKVELGDGSGTCGACHGDGKSAWPSTRVHQAHALTTLTNAVTCDQCHAVPAQLKAPFHLDGKVQVQLAQLGDAGLTASFASDTKRCSNVTCHGAGLASSAHSEPVWDDAHAQPETCNGCHATPPAPPHVRLTACGGSLCHGNEVGPSGSGLRISESGRALHLDGIVEAGQ